MDPLITIETVPISIEYVERKSNYTSTKLSADLSISQQDNATTIQSNPISLQLQDTFELSSSLDWSNLSYTATAQFGNDGNLCVDLQIAENDSNAYAYQQFDRGIDNIMGELSTKKPSFKFDSVQINFDMSKLIENMPGNNDSDTSFLLPDLELKVVERAKVIIKYVGGPIYFPRSADPDYVPAEDTNIIFDGKSNLDVKA